MAEGAGLEQVWRRALEANARYYEALGQVTTDYLKALVGVLGDVRLPASLGGRPAAAPATAQPAAPAPSAMVLEGVAGETAVGAFMVQNRLDQRVAAPVVTSAFLDPSGAEVRPALVFEPDVISLDPGEQMLVRVTTVIDDRLEPGTGYRGEVTIPGLSGDRVALVLRRREGGNGKPPSTAVAKPPGKSGGKARGRRTPARGR
jgi:hypothetical protein